jgi:hypothetical protein
MDGWMGRWMDVWMDGWMDGWVDGWVDGWMNRVCGWMDTAVSSEVMLVQCVHICLDEDR